MCRHFFDYEDGNFAHTISDNMAINSDGDLLMRMGDNMAMDMESGELHFISGWSDNEEEWIYVTAARIYPSAVTISVIKNNHNFYKISNSRL